MNTNDIFIMNRAEWYENGVLWFDFIQAVTSNKGTQSVTLNE